MQPWKRNAWLLWLAVLVVSACWSMVMPFMPIFLKEELGVTTGVSTWAGALSAINALGITVMSPVWGVIGDRYGRKLMMLRAGAFLVVSYALMSLVTGPWGLFGVRALIGAFTGFIPTATALVATTTPQAHVGKAISLVATASPTGTILGPFVGGLLSDLLGMRGTMLAGSLLTGAAALLVLVAVKEQFTPVKGEGVHLVADMREVLQHKSFAALMVTMMLLSAGLQCLEPVLMPYIKALLFAGAPNWLAGGLYSLPGLAFVLATPWWVARGERWGYGNTVALGLAAGALLLVPQALAVTGWDFGGFRLTHGLAIAAVSPGISALTAMVMPPVLRGRAFGIQNSCSSIGTVVGPLAGGLLATLAGPRWVFVLGGLLLGGGALWTRTVVRPLIARRGATAEAPGHAAADM